jgi:hypothetical protein
MVLNDENQPKAKQFVLQNKATECHANKDAHNSPQGPLKVVAKNQQPK